MAKISGNEYKLEIPTANILLDPSTPTAIEFKAANYNPAGWSNVVADFWHTIGNQSTGMDNEKIVISNNQIIEAYKPGDNNAVLPGQNTNGIDLSADGKTIKIYVGQHGGWSVHIAYSVTNVSLTLIVSNVATNYAKYGYSGSFNNWNAFQDATILGTNANGTVNITGTFTYTGSGKVEYKVRGSNDTTGTNWAWSSNPNRTVIILSTDTAYTDYNPGPINF